MPESLTWVASFYPGFGVFFQMVAVLFWWGLAALLSIIPFAILKILADN